METLVNDPNFDLERFADSLAKDGREGVKWERRKLCMDSRGRSGEEWG